MLVVRDVTVRFGTTTVLDRVGLEVGDGEVVALLGPSGSGKSTLLRVIAGLITPATGAVVLDGRDLTAVPTHRRGIGMVFQDEQLFPHRDVAANIAFGLRMRRVAAPARRARVAELLALVGLDGFDHRRVTDLSGGEAKRVALARSLAPSPGALLLDEPLTGLDRELHDRLADEVARILRRAATTALVVTHDHDEAATLADRVVTIDALGPAKTAVVSDLAATETHGLRAAVLRDGTPSTAVVFDGDHEATTVHLGVRDEAGHPLVVSTWLRRPYPVEPEEPAVQLRAMATAPAARRRGLAGAVVTVGVQRAFAGGATLVWARARDTALDFYRHNGFDVIEPGFVDDATALAHHLIVRRRD